MSRGRTSRGLRAIGIYAWAPILAFGDAKRAACCWGTARDTYLASWRAITDRAWDSR